MFGNAGTCGIGTMKGSGPVGTSGTLLVDLVIGVCTTVQSGLMTVTIGSITAPAA